MHHKSFGWEKANKGQQTALSTFYYRSLHSKNRHSRILELLLFIILSGTFDPGIVGRDSSIGSFLEG